MDISYKNKKRDDFGNLKYDKKIWKKYLIFFFVSLMNAKNIYKNIVEDNTVFKKNVLICDDLNVCDKLEVSDDNVTFKKNVKMYENVADS